MPNNSVYDANESGSDLTVGDVSGSAYVSGDNPWETPSGVVQISTYPNAGPVQTYPGQGGVQIGGGVQVGLPGGAQISLGGTTGGAGVSNPGLPGSIGPRPAAGIFASGGMLWIIILIAVAVVLFK